MKRYLKILLAPLSALLSTLIWLCAGVLSISVWIFRLASVLVTLIGLAVLLTYSVKNGVVLLVIAFLISPMGLPMLAVRAMGLLQNVICADIELKEGIISGDDTPNAAAHR